MRADILEKHQTEVEKELMEQLRVNAMLAEQYDSIVVERDELALELQRKSQKSLHTATAASAAAGKVVGVSNEDLVAMLEAQAYAMEDILRAPDYADADADC